MNSTELFPLSETATAINVALSLPTNSYILWLIVAGTGDMVVREFFPLNLAVYEILFCLFSTCDLISHLFPTKAYLTTFASGFLFGGRPILQCSICMEQFLAVVHPVFFLRYKPLRYKVAFSGVTWAVIIGLTLFYTFMPLIKHLAFVSQCAVLISVMLFCYFSVLVALKRPRPGKGKKERGNKMKMRALLNLSFIILSFVGTYFLWCIAIVSKINIWFTNGQTILTEVCTSITLVNGFAQPLIYLQRRGKCSCTKAV